MMMMSCFEFYHRSGKKIVIEDVPKSIDNHEEDFRIMTNLQKQIDRIEMLPDPKSRYKYLFTSLKQS